MFHHQPLQHHLMMRDPTIKEPWIDELVMRVSQIETTNSSLRVTIPGPCQSGVSTNDTARSASIKFSRTSDTLEVLRHLPPTANILLFTPVIIPAGQTSSLTAEGDTMDPFEVFGRALSTYHAQIRHVPYVAKVGFTDTHDQFIDEADAVITVVCEPESDKSASATNQLDFAEIALDALEDKETDEITPFVLVQCGADEHRLPVDGVFGNLIESQTYDAETAKFIAHMIFSTRISRA